ncbi:uncharacterized protein LOC143298300 [Babylonia areolata]|uniref:uncharacterized protein LOC143298300 n=1 Tax=Babylonia areolata TaxID=304850 RepID=UPI003FD2A1A3
MGLRILISAVLLSLVTMHINGQTYTRITTCIFKSCPPYQECRIVVESNVLIEPRCLNSSEIPQSKKNPCGSSGHPILQMKKKGKNVVYKHFKCSVCPSFFLVLIEKRRSAVPTHVSRVSVVHSCCKNQISVGVNAMVTTSVQTNRSAAGVTTRTGAWTPGNGGPVPQ